MNVTDNQPFRMPDRFVVPAANRAWPAVRGAFLGWASFAAGCLLIASLSGGALLGQEIALTAWSDGQEDGAKQSPVPATAPALETPRVVFKSNRAAPGMEEGELSYELRFESLNDGEGGQKMRLTIPSTVREIEITQRQITQRQINQRPINQHQSAPFTADPNETSPEPDRSADSGRNITNPMARFASFRAEPSRLGVKPEQERSAHQANSAILEIPDEARGMGFVRNPYYQHQQLTPLPHEDGPKTGQSSSPQDSKTNLPKPVELQTAAFVAVDSKSMEREAFEPATRAEISSPETQPVRVHLTDGHQPDGN